MTQPRAPRADAVRNRTKILQAARKQITQHGPDTGMDEIAAAAGVAVGTLYRHFPTKTDLVAAVVWESVDHVAADAAACLARAESDGRASEEVISFLGRVVEASATNLAVKAAASGLGADGDHQDSETRASDALAALIKHAQAECALRPDLTVADIYLLMATAPTDQPPPVRERWLSLVLFGLTRPPRGMPPSA
ncbi:helix-turn-helix domain-containing protein [Streptomyces sp. NPDC002766]|uniref:TetR/AcrR family transcriptional regulator n=1 Tax=unclassified Streptomyces TaxID=2593676 RepID=UPI003329765C